MRTIISPIEHDAALADWVGATVLIHAVSPTFRRSVLSLWRKGEPDLLYLICIGCRHINGPFSWQDAQLRIERAMPPPHDQPQCRVIDVRAVFELVCSDVILARGPAHTFPDPLEGLIPSE